MSTNIHQINQAFQEFEAQPFFQMRAGSSSADSSLDHAATTHLHARVHALLETIEDNLLRAMMLRLFSDLLRLLDYLRLSEMEMRDEGSSPATVTFFTMVHEEARALLDFIETRALCANNTEALTDALDSTTFAINHELKRVFELELSGLTTLEPSTLLDAKVAHGRGLLVNCFQQSLLILAQAFDPTLDAAHLFSDLPTRVEQSLVLRKDLWKLVAFARRAESSGDLESIMTFIQCLDDFRIGSMRYLMYRDWQSYERFVEEVLETKNICELAPVLNRFACYLETLFSQVRMRAVLANHPFDYAEAAA